MINNKIWNKKYEIVESFTDITNIDKNDKHFKWLKTQIQLINKGKLPEEYVEKLKKLTIYNFFKLKSKITKKKINDKIKIIYSDLKVIKDMNTLIKEKSDSLFEKLKDFLNTNSNIDLSYLPLAITHKEIPEMFKNELTIK
jgi:hypothetical protein